MPEPNNMAQLVDEHTKVVAFVTNRDSLLASDFTNPGTTTEAVGIV